VFIKQIAYHTFNNKILKWHGIFIKKMYIFVALRSFKLCYQVEIVNTNDLLIQLITKRFDKSYKFIG